MLAGIYISWCYTLLLLLPFCSNFVVSLLSACSSPLFTFLHFLLLFVCAFCYQPHCVRFDLLFCYIEVNFIQCVSNCVMLWSHFVPCQAHFFWQVILWDEVKMMCHCLLYCVPFTSLHFVWWKSDYIILVYTYIPWPLHDIIFTSAFYYIWHPWCYEWTILSYLTIMVWYVCLIVWHAQMNLVTLQLDCILWLANFVMGSVYFVMCTSDFVAFLPHGIIWVCIVLDVQFHSMSSARGTKRKWKWLLFMQGDFHY